MSKVLATGALAIAVVGCASAPTNYPIRTEVGGQRGYTMQGTLRSRGSLDQTKQWIHRAFEAGCRGPVEITQINIEPRGSSIGLKFYDYDAAARCLGPTRSTGEDVK